jgi:hypothetical protein
LDPKSKKIKNFKKNVYYNEFSIDGLKPSIENMMSFDSPEILIPSADPRESDFLKREHF